MFRPATVPYRAHQDEQNLYLETDMPGVNLEDVEVQVLKGPPVCMVQWTSTRRRTPDEMPVSHRVRMGGNVDCDQLSANLSRGVLTLTAPRIEKEESVDQPRSIPIQHTD
eukprot:Nitzschia sp. Nitz4//scaffold218_size35881//9666//9995//NITZ4_007790-RA/size35881-processed-gene-0.15-mRNA-1//-1//CDS//3329542268//314//frame0